MIIKTDQDTIRSYYDDASGLLGGHAERVIIPGSVKEIADYLAEASRKKLHVTIAGGGTGVTGGRIPFGGDVLSLELLNRIGPFRELCGGETHLTAQAGALIKAVKDTATTMGRMYPPDPTEQSSSIGGNIATNASGARGFKYGSTRRYVRRLQVVLATGEILDIERGKYRADDDGIFSVDLAARTLEIELPKYSLPDIKNAAGYYNRAGMDLIDLFIGHEGTLGVVTEAELILAPMVHKTLGSIAFFHNKEDSWNFVREAKKISRGVGNDVIEAITLEYFDRSALDMLRSGYPDIPAFADAAIFFEQVLDGRDEGAVTAGWARLLENHGAPLESAWFSSGTREQKTFREFRHRLPEKVNEIVRRNGFPKTGTDLAVPDGSFGEMMRYYYEAFAASGVTNLLFGHIGECHMHANLLPASEAEFRESKRTYAALAEKALSLGGTVSAEHGIGKLKHSFIEAMVGKEGLAEMARLKRSLDPAGILGRGNLFPASFLD